MINVFQVKELSIKEGILQCQVSHGCAIHESGMDVGDFYADWETENWKTTERLMKDLAKPASCWEGLTQWK